MSWGSKPGRDKILLFSKTSISALGPAQPLFREDKGSVPGRKRPKRDLDHSHPSRAEDKNEWSERSTPPIRLHDVDRDFTLALLYFGLRLVTLHGKQAATDP